MTKQNIKVVKVPLNPDEKAASNKMQVFPRMPRLYLELLENKAKIKPDLVNKDYVPTNSNYASTTTENTENTRKQEFYDRYDEVKREENPAENIKDDNQVVSPDYSSKKDNTDDDFESRLNKYLEENKSKDKGDDTKDDKYYKSDDEYDRDRDRDRDREKEPVDDFKSPSSDISERLKELLNDKDDDITSPTVRVDKYSRQRSLSNYRSVEHYKKQNDDELPPALSELENRGGFIRKKEMRDITHSYNDQHDDDLKRELMFKIELLKKSYPNALIPEFSIHSDYVTMKKTYDSTVRRLSLDSSVDSYKTYLIGGFMFCEFILGNYLGFDMQGFTQQQILTMNSYEKLLIELGEKSYMPQGSKWPVEVRLLFMIIMNAVLFIVSKMIMKKTGSNLIGMINSMNSAAQPTQHNINKKKMKPPNINLDEIPEVNELPV